METNKKLLNKREVLAATGMSNSHFYKSVQRGDIETVRIGRRIFVKAGWLERITQSKE